MSRLAEELKELGISAAELARQIDVPLNRVTGVMNGQRAITADTALRLGNWFGISPEFWLNLQKLYALRLAREEIGDRGTRLTERKRIKGGEPPKVARSAIVACRTDITGAKEDFSRHRHLV
jgi:antitoxin HigA-1